MAKKLVASLLAIVLCFLVWLVSCSPESSTLPSQPHLNPETLTQVYSDAELMRYTVGVLDFVIAEKPQELERLKNKLRFAAIRPETEESARRLLSSEHSLSRNMVMSKADLEAIMLLAKQNRLDEVKELALGLVRRLPPALTDLDEMEKSAKAMGRMANVDKSPEGSEIRIAYEQATQLLAKIGQPIRLISQFSQDGDIEALLKKLQIEIDLKRYSALRPTELNIAILPVRAYIGDTISFKGKLTSRDVSLPGKDIVLELDSKHIATVKADSDGYYSGELRLPYRYNESITIRSRYLPLGGDTDVYLAAISPSVKVETPFYTGQLRLGAPLKGYPGRNTAIEGGFRYADPPLAGTRKVEIFIDGSPSDSAVVAEDFNIELALDSKMSVGRHQVTVVAPGQERYGPATAEATLNIVKATPVVDLKTTRLVLIPRGLEVRGKAESEIAPLNTAQIRLRFGQKVIETKTGVDGTFQYHIGLSLFTTLIGRQGLEVEVTPLEPWNDSISTQKNIWVFNPIGLAIILAVVAIVYYRVKLRMKARKVEPSTVSHPPILAPEGVSGTSGIMVGQELGREIIDLRPGEDRILQIYKAAVSFIIGILGIKIKPHLTLRELAEELSPRLGAASSYMWQMTLIVEKVLYSKHSLIEKDRQNVEDLASQTRQGIKHGPQ